MGGAEGVVGEAAGVRPEWIAKVKKVKEPEDAATREVGPEGSKGAAKVDDEDDEGGDVRPDKASGQSNWLKKVKVGVASIKEKAKDVRDSAASSITSSSTRDRSNSAASSTADPNRARSRSTGAKSTVGFDIPADGDAPPIKPVVTRVITDFEGTPVPTDIGPTGGGTPTTSMRDAPVANSHGGGLAPPPTGANASTTTSVRDKILESHDVDPRTTNEKFHSLFKEIPDDEELIEDYRSALQRDILVQGRLFVSEHFLSFRANILGWETSLQIPWSEIISIEKRFTAKIVPNAIEVRTLHATHTFASFLSRDAAYALLVAVWRHVHPEADEYRAKARAERQEERKRRRAFTVSSLRSAKSAPNPAGMTDHDSETDGDDEHGADSKSEISFEDEHGHKKRHRFKLRSGLAALGLNSLVGRDRSASVSAGSSSASTSAGPTEAEKVKAQAQAASAGVDTHPPTEYTGPEYKNEALDTILPTSPDKAFKLFFLDAEFLRKFMAEKENLHIEIGKWQALADGDLKRREMTYVKPLNAPVGPKQTHCNITDTNENLDENSYFSNLTVTKTPDVPSGNDFSTVTRTVFTWAEGGCCRVRVTTEVEWTKVNRFLRGVIERGAVEGQTSYHRDLETMVRDYIAAHPDEYGIDGGAPSAVESTSAAPEVKATDTAATETKPAQTSARFLGSLLDSLPEPSIPMAALAILVAFLALTNLFTLISLRKQAAIARSVRIGHPGEVSAAVSRVLSEFNDLHTKRAADATGEGLAGEVEELGRVLKGLERTLHGVMGDMHRALHSVKEVADRTEGIKSLS
ncbi:gram domain protein [Rhodotorula toruloides]|uniref:Gram domain protein n=1 Tax=Rhodotorula toruloides TaxID=5286 RepID=A0A511KE45_RHOTO|nr:gram domain protein [Rhodotorula toruloides]